MEIIQTTNETRVIADGEWTIYTAADCTAKLRESLSSPTALTLDLSAVTELDSAGVQLLLALQRQQLVDGKSFAVSSVSPAVREVLSCLRLNLNGSSLHEGKA